MIKKNRKNIVIYITITFLYVLNIIQFVRGIHQEYYPFFDDVNRFSFWEYSFHRGMITIVMFLLPAIVCFISLYDFSEKTGGSYFKSVLLRQKYSDYFKRELLTSYLKIIIPFLLISILIFIMGSLLYKAEITNITYADIYSEFNYLTNYSPYYHVFISNIIIAFFLGFVFNISLVLYRVVKKISLATILTFIATNVLNFIISGIFTILAPFFNSEVALRFESFNMYNGYLGGYYINFNLCVFFILFIISLFLTIVLYNNKEKVVLAFE